MPTALAEAKLIFCLFCRIAVYSGTDSNDNAPVLHGKFTFVKLAVAKSSDTYILYG